jgi:SanA protein
MVIGPMKINYKSTLRILLIISGVFLTGTMGINLYVIMRAKGCVIDQIAKLPSREVALVLGVEPVRPDGSPNQHFINRTTGAAEVYMSGKAKFLLLSGNSNNRGYNEVLEMQKEIIALRVPATAITHQSLA